MRRVFADTHFYIALLNREDSAHRRVVHFLADRHIEAIVTTRWVLVELANTMAKSRRRLECGRFIEGLTENLDCKVIGLSDALQDRGLRLYLDRADKGWSLTDCISFIVMADEGLTEALTADHHFEQAGFTALLA